MLPLTAKELRGVIDQAGLFEAIDRHFLQAEQLERVRVFSRTARQIEGWFKGELMYLLSKLHRDGAIARWQVDARAANDDRQRFDFRIEIGDELLYLELAALHFTPQRNVAASLGSTELGVLNQYVVKLSRLDSGRGYCLLFVYPRPDVDHWSEAIGDFRRRAAPVIVREESALDRFPPDLYICKLAVEGGF